jgi:uncharacterized protein
VKNVEEKPLNNRQSKYIVDSMFGTVAKKLRILGFDTYYDSNLKDEDVIQIGIEQDRTIITADKELFSKTVNKKIPAILLTSRNDLNNVGSILRHDLKDIGFNQTLARCSVCNGELKECPKETIRSKVKEGVFQNYECFFECKNCSKVYWMGTHIDEIKLWIRKLNEIIKSSND